MNKKALAPIVAFVLLMGLAVAIGTFVTVWYTKASEKQTEEALGKYMSGEECSDVRFDVSFDYENCAAVVYNLGSFKIDKVKVDRYFKSAWEGHDVWDTGRGSDICASGGLIPKNGCAVPMNSSELSKLLFVPLLGSGEKLVQCLNEREFVPAGAFSNCPAGT